MSAFPSTRLVRTLEVWDTKPPADWMITHKPIALSRTKQKRELDSPSLWGANIQPTWLHCLLAFALTLATSMFVVANFDALAEASDFRIERRQVVFLCWMQDSNLILEVRDAKSPVDWMPTDKPTELSRIKQNLEFDSPSTMMSEHSVHLTSLPVGFRTSGLWRIRVVANFYAFVFLCLMQGSNFGSLRHQIASRLNAHSQTDWTVDFMAIISMINFESEF